MPEAATVSRLLMSLVPCVSGMDEFSYTAATDLSPRGHQIPLP